MTTTYDYQPRLISECLEHLNKSKRCVLAAGCGAGKSRMSVDIVKSLLTDSPKARVIVLAHGQKELRSQLSATYEGSKLPYSVSMIEGSKLETPSTSSNECSRPQVSCHARPSSTPMAALLLLSHGPTMLSRPALPSNPTRAKRADYDQYVDKERHLVEIFFNRIKHFRRVNNRTAGAGFFPCRPRPRV